jgi:superfamily II DNA or RNA helicase
MQLRDYQQKCVDAILAARAEGIRRQLVVSATGTGKSLIFSSLPQYMPKGKRMLMVVNAIELAAQGAAHLRKWNPSLSIGVEMGGEISSDEQVIVASVQTLGKESSARRSKFRPEDFEWLVVDEAHFSLSQTYHNVYNYFGVFNADSAVNLIGFTATPDPGQSRDMGDVYEKVTFNYGLRQAIKDGWLSDVRGLRVTTTTDISGVSTTAGDFDQAELGQAVNTPQRNYIVVREFIANGWPRQTIGFTVNIQHAKDAAAAFQKAGIPAEAIWGSDPERDRKLADHRAGKTQVLLCSQLLVTGYDDPNVSCILMLRPTKSRTFFQQAVGRGTRLGPGIDNLGKLVASGLLRPTDKRDCLLIDYVDVSSRHSLVTLPTLFGLGAKLDLRGRSAVQVLEEVEQAAKQHPNVDLSKLEDATRLKSFVEEVGLFQVNFAEETAQYSSLEWRKAPAGNFVLLLPEKGEQLVVGENLLGRWSVWGKVGGVGVDEPFYSSLPEALDAAEQIVSTLGARAMSYLRKDSKYKAKKVTDKQRALLTKWKVPAHVIEGMNAGSAGAYITKKIKEWQNKGARQ